MTFYPDESECTYFKRSPKLTAIGWLEAGHPFSRGPVEQSFFDKLGELFIKPWEPYSLAGRHECEFCRFTGGPAAIAVNGTKVFLGSSNLFVPAGTRMYVVPSMALHYIDAHEYAPPMTFQDAVMNCPSTEASEYRRKIEEYGLTRLSLRG
jgi:hypothetical protein